MSSAPAPARSLPWGLAGCALLIPCIYLPTLFMPFDFVDDGCLVYPTAAPSLGGYVRQVLDRTVTEFHARGPFRPVCWAHWEAAANLLGPHAPLHRLTRLAWAALSTALFLWLLRELGFPRGVAAGTVALAMWNPSRGEIWLGLGLTEAFAMPYALLALIAAARASRSTRPLRWDLLAVAGLLGALGVKNTFAALVPPVVYLRLTAGGLPLREGWRRHRLAAVVLGLTLAGPVAHFLLYRLAAEHPTYQVGFTWLQGPRLVRAVLSSANYPFVLLGLALPLAACTVLRRPGRGPAPDGPPGPSLCRRYRPALGTAILLAVLGVAIYLPFHGLAGRYTMPAAWGLDILVAFLWTALLQSGTGLAKRVAFAALAAGLCVAGLANLDAQREYRTRAEMLWQAVGFVEARAPRGAGIAWLTSSGGDVLPEDMPPAEACHFAWHLHARRRPDLVVRTADSADRATLLGGPPAAADPWAVIAAAPPQAGSGWRLAGAFRPADAFGRSGPACFAWVRR